MALARAADGGVAGHIAHRVQVDGKADRLHPEARAGKRCLDARVSRADNGNVVAAGLKFTHALSPFPV